MDTLLKRISVNPKICHGKPCIKGHRVMVYQILQLLEQGKSFDEILYSFPTITRKDIQACIRYATAIVKDEDIFLYGEQ